MTFPYTEKDTGTEWGLHLRDRRILIVDVTSDKAPEAHVVLVGSRYELPGTLWYNDLPLWFYR